jgi:hypothetical protein
VCITACIGQTLYAINLLKKGYYMPPFEICEHSDNVKCRFAVTCEACIKKWAANAKECANLQAHNSDYAAALRVFGEFCEDQSGSIIRDFRYWCEVRLNPAKAPDCA